MKRLPLLLVVCCTACAAKTTYYEQRMYPARNTPEAFAEDKYKCDALATQKMNAYYPVITFSNMKYANFVYRNAFESCLSNFGWVQAKK